MDELRGARADLRGNLAEIKRQWKPVGLLLALMAWCGRASDLWHTVRDFVALLPLVLASACLLTLLLIAAPRSGLKLIFSRIVAFLLDLLLLSSGTLAILSLLHRFDAGRGPLILTLVMWLWFLYFVLFETLLHRTPGKRAFGLTLIFHRHAGARFLTCLARTSLSLLAPLIALYFVRNPVGWRYAYLSPSAMSMVVAVSSLGPLSILFLGGSRGLADWMAGTSVRKNAYGECDPDALFTAWRRLCLACLSLSLLAWWAEDLLDRQINPYFDALAAKVNPAHPTLREQLWLHLPVGLRNPHAVINEIGVWDLPNPYEKDEPSDFLVRLPYKDDLYRQKQIRVVVLSLSPAATSAVRGRLMDNLGSWCIWTTRPEELPAFTVLELIDKEDFGPFTLASAENMVLCLRRTEKGVIGFYLQPARSRSASINANLNLSRLFLGPWNDESFRTTLWPLLL